MSEIKTESVTLAEVTQMHVLWKPYNIQLQHNNDR